MALPPWLMPADLVGAARSGAALGLSIRAQDQAAEEQAARLALAQDQLNVAQTRNAMQFQQAQERAAEALRRDNELSIYRRQTQERLNRIDQENRAREAARMALDRERFDFTKSQAKEKSSVKPNIFELPDASGKPHAVLQTGPSTFHLLPEEKDTTSKALTAIEQRDLQANQREIQKQRFQALKDQNQAAADAAAADLLRNKTAQSNLVLSAKQPKAAAPVPPSTGLPSFQSDEEKQSWMNAKRAIESGKNRQKILDQMQKAGFTLEGL